MIVTDDATGVGRDGRVGVWRAGLESRYGVLMLLLRSRDACGHFPVPCPRIRSVGEAGLEARGDLTFGGGRFAASRARVHGLAAGTKRTRAHRYTPYKRVHVPRPRQIFRPRGTCAHG